MNINDVITKHNFISSLLLKGEKDADELSKELKIKIVKMRIQLFNIRNAFEKEAQEAFKEFTPPILEELLKKKSTLKDGETLTDEEEEDLKKMVEKRTEDYNAYITSRGQEEIPEKIETDITSDEFYKEILPVNINNDVEINKQKIPASTFLEIFYGLFVKKDIKVVNKNTAVPDSSAPAQASQASVIDSSAAKLTPDSSSAKI